MSAVATTICCTIFHYLLELGMVRECLHALVAMRSDWRLLSCSATRRVRVLICMKDASRLVQQPDAARS